MLSLFGQESNTNKEQRQQSNNTCDGNEVKSKVHIIHGKIGYHPGLL